MTDDDLLRSLDELGAELKVRDRPDHRAWYRLAPTKSGWTTRLYDDQAFTLWRDVHKRFPDDLHTVHHLAIMHHARAIDLEQSDHPARSDVDWRTALTFWHQLYETDEFWVELANGVDLAMELVPQVRTELAERLLRLHFDIALDERSPHNRGRFHVQLALGAPFPRELVEQVRTTSYERAIDDIDTAVWAPGTVEPEALWPAVERIVHYLDLDDNCAPALADLGKLLTKVQVGLVHKANGIPNKDDMSQVLDEIRTVAAKYDTYIRRTEQALLAAPEPDELALSDLASWFGRVAQACNLRHVYDEAAKWYDRARVVARAGNDDREHEYRAEVAYATVLLAREHVDDEPERAKALLRSASESNRLPALVLMVRGRTWLLVDELDKAEQDAARALKALGTLAELFPTFSGADEVGLREEILLLDKHVKEVAKRVAECGGPAAARLHRKGITAFNEGKHGTALELLRQAREVAAPRPTETLNEDLAMCLNAIAVTRAEQAVKSLGPGGGPLPGRLGGAGNSASSTNLSALFGDPDAEWGASGVVLESYQLLEEAARLSSNRAIKDNLAAVTALYLRLRRGL